MAKNEIVVHEIATILAALKWWQGRSGKIPMNLKYLFETMPPLTEEELGALIKRLELVLPGVSHVKEHPL